MAGDGGHSSGGPLWEGPELRRGEEGCDGKMERDPQGRVQNGQGIGNAWT